MSPWGWRKQRGADDRSTKADDAKSIGLEVLYEPSVVRLNVIFVSGQGSIGIRPWAHENGIAWPVDLLPKDLPDVRTLLWNHSTTLDSPSSILNCARGLLSDIRAFIADAETQSIAFVALSGGGNIVKEALSIAVGDPYEHIALNTIGILFLGTPHHCPKHLRNFEKIARLYRICGIHLAPMFLLNPEYLDDQNQRFVADLGPYKLRTYSFYESQGISFPTMKKRPIVDDVAATSGYPAEEVMPLEASHRLLGRYPGRNDANYIRVLYCLKLLARIPLSRSFPHVEPSNTNTSNEVNREVGSQLRENENASLMAGSIPDGSYDIELNPNTDQIEVKTTASGSELNPNTSQIAISRTFNGPSSTNPANEKGDPINKAHRQLHGLRGAIYDSDNSNKHDLPGNGRNAQLSSASDQEISASTRPTSLSSENIRSSPENQLPPTSESKDLSLEPRLPRSLTSPSVPAMSDTTSTSNTPASSDYLVKGSQAIIRAASKATGMTVAERTAIANACLAGTGLVIAAANPLIAGKSLSVAKESLEQAKISARAATQSAMAGSRSAHYAKRISRSQRNSTKDESSDDSKDSSDSSDSSRGFGHTTTRRQKGRTYPKKHSVYQTDIQRLNDLPKPPEEIYERVQPQTSRSTPDVERVADQDRPVQAIAYDRFGNALNVDVDEASEYHHQNAAMEEHSNKRDFQAGQSHGIVDNDIMLPFTTSAGLDETHRTAKIDPQEPMTEEPIAQAPNEDEKQPRVDRFVPTQNANVGATITTEQREVTDDPTATKLNSENPVIPVRSLGSTENSRPESELKERLAQTSVSNPLDSPGSDTESRAVERDAVSNTGGVGRSSVRQGFDDIPGTDVGDEGFEMDVIRGAEQSFSRPDALVSDSKS